MSLQYGTFRITSISLSRGAYDMNRPGIEPRGHNTKCTGPPEGSESGHEGKEFARGPDSEPEGGPAHFLLCPEGSMLRADSVVLSILECAEMRFFCGTEFTC